MIFITPVVSRAVQATKEYIARGLEGLTVGKIGDVPIFGRANSQQLAYDGYRANIECFIQATASKTKIVTSSEGFSFPDDYEFQAPFALPRTVFKLSGDMSTEQRGRFENSLRSEGLEKVDGKEKNLYTIQRPSPTTLKKLKQIAHPRTIHLTDYAQLEGTLDLLPVFNYLDAFLATNTYSYKKSDYPVSNETKRIIHAELRACGKQWYREGFSEKKDSLKKIALGKEVPQGRKVDHAETEDLTPHMDTEYPQTIVLVAKPSLNPSSASWGHPSSVPNKSGLVFPYFDGMLLADTGFVRRSVSTFFLRLMGENTKAAHSSFAILRKTMGTATTTPQGIVLTHVLMGIDLALQTQTQVYLLFDGTAYLGFVLLGEEFIISMRGKLYEPLAPADLRKELLEMHTHDGALEALVGIFGQCTLTGGDNGMITKEEIETGPLLLNQLAEIDTERTDKEVIGKLSEMLKRLNFPGDYLSFSPTNLRWAIEQMTLFVDIELTDEKVFIPIKDWEGMQRKVAQVMACFGPRSPSFIDPKGREITVRTSSFFGEYEGEGRTRKRTNNRFIVYEKILTQAIKDWDKLEKDGKMKINLEERAIGSRGHVFQNDSIDVIWNALKSGSEARAWGEEAVAIKIPMADKGKKRKRDDDVAGVSMADFDSLF
jgi:hypothetical protein